MRDFVNLYQHQRGTVCVTRIWQNTPVALRVDDSLLWWGCYSIL